MRSEIKGAETRVKIRTGFPSLDKSLGGGLGRGKIAAVGSRPGMGRSAFLRSVTSRAEGRRVRLEGTDPFGSPIRWSALRKQLKRAARGGASLVLVEDLDAVFGCFGNRYKKLKKYAEKTGVAVIFSVKLPRALEKRRDKRPVLGDFDLSELKNSGIEAASDAVLALYRDSYYSYDDIGGKADETPARAAEGFLAPFAQTDPQSAPAPEDELPNGELLVLKSGGKPLDRPAVLPLVFDGKNAAWRTPK